MTSEMTNADACELLRHLAAYVDAGHPWRWEGDGGNHASLGDGLARMTFAVEPRTFWELRKQIEAGDAPDDLRDPRLPRVRPEVPQGEGPELPDRDAL